MASSRSTMHKRRQSRLPSSLWVLWVTLPLKFSHAHFTLCVTVKRQLSSASVSFSSKLRSVSSCLIHSPPWVVFHGAWAPSLWQREFLVLVRLSCSSFSCTSILVVCSNAPCSPLLAEYC